MGSPKGTTLVGFRASPIQGAIAAAMGGLLSGFDSAVIAGATTVYRPSPLFLGFIVSSVLLGTILGAKTAGLPAERLARKAGYNRLSRSLRAASRLFFSPA